ncbi:sulfate transporter 1.2-like protein [Tanacetum coccineum]
MGSSRDIAIGPVVVVVSLLLGTVIQNEYDPVNDANEYRRLAFTATFFPGITQATLGFLRLKGKAATQQEAKAGRVVEQGYVPQISLHNTGMIGVTLK